MAAAQCTVRIILRNSLKLILHMYLMGRPKHRDLNTMNLNTSKYRVFVLTRSAQVIAMRSWGYE